MMSHVDLANAILRNAHPRTRTCTYPGCSEPVLASRCEEHFGVALPKCGDYSQPATRRCAYDVADVCEDCGEQSDRAKAEIERHEKRLAAMELI